jgi:hypothetical protein
MALFGTPLPGFRPAGTAWYFGAPRSGGRIHEGLDLAAPLGTAAYAMAAGVVIQAGQGTTASGLAVTIGHAGGWQTFGCHYARITDKIKPGAAVEAGDFVALVGETGNAEGPHLHLGVRWAGRALDPLPLIAWPEHRGAAALWLQGRLLAHGYDPGPLDGIAGETTLRELGLFQRASGLPVTWLVDYLTRPALKRAAR